MREESKAASNSGHGAAKRSEDSSHETDRSLERVREDQRSESVIIKRWDEARRHPDDILEHAITAGQEQLSRRGLSLFLSSIAAGLMLGFSAMAVGVVSTTIGAEPGALSARLAIALVYPVGFILCILSGTELFTEHTATALYPVLDDRSRVRCLLRLWTIVWAGNLVGAACIAALLWQADGVIHAAPGYRAIVQNMLGHDTWQLLLSSVLAGWLMALGAWLVNATPPSINQTAAIFIVTFLIGFGHLHHSIAGSVELFVAMMCGLEVSAGKAVWFIAVVTLGNLLGGSLLAAALNYGHIRKSQEHD
jgi:formate/nitrite transporter FocA (FNT family)